MTRLRFNLQRLQQASIIIAAVLAAVLSTGCATTSATGKGAPSTVAASQIDPFEALNRKVFSFNEGFDRMILKPAATAYKQVVPGAVQTGVSNFFSNLQTPWSSLHMVLQGRVREAASTAARFGVNTTVGLLGLFDVAEGWGLPARSSEDFGLTLDTWGVGSGPYLVLPLLGPSTVRDTLTTPVDILADPKGQIADVGVRNSLTALSFVNKRSELLSVGQVVDQAALDEYLFVRDAQLQRRNRSAQRRTEDQPPNSTDTEIPKQEVSPEERQEVGDKSVDPN